VSVREPAGARDVGVAEDASRHPRSVADAPRVVHVDGPAEDEACDHCGERRLAWRKCKLICANCSHINKSCADL
jgi:hypothetical protein